MDVGPPRGGVEHAQVDGLTVLDADGRLGEQVGLVLVPVGQDVRAIGDVVDPEGAVGIAAAHVQGVVVAIHVNERQQRPIEVSDDLLPAEATQLETADRGSVFGRPDDRAPDRANGGDGQRRLKLHEAELGEREWLGALHELGVVAVPALDRPGVPVVPALERARLEPDLPVRRRDRRRVAVRAEVRDRDHAIRVAEAVATDRLDQRPAVDAEQHQPEPVMLVGGAQRVSVPVVGDRREDVVDVALEADEHGLAGVVRAIRLQVVPDLHPDGGEGERVRLERDGHQAGRVGRVEPLTVDLEAVDVAGDGRADGAARDVEPFAEHRDHVLAQAEAGGIEVDGDGLAEVRLAALGDHLSGRPPALRVDPRPLAVGRVGRITGA